MNRPTLLVTRPQPQADAWVVRLSALGVDAAALPLLAIAGAPDPAALGQAWASLSTQELVMFVNGVVGAPAAGLGGVQFAGHSLEGDSRAGHCRQAVRQSALHWVGARFAGLACSVAVGAGGLERDPGIVAQRQSALLTAESVLDKPAL